MAQHTVILRSDGDAVAFGLDDHGQCSVPPLPSGVRYVNAAVGGLHTVLLNDNGRAVCFGYNADGQCDAPAPPPGLR